MIIDLKKYLFWGSKDQIEHFFSNAQKAGFIEFFGLKKKSREIPENVKTISRALKILRKQPVVHAGKDELIIPADALAERILHIQNTLEKLYEEERLIKAEITRVGFFGDFNLKDLSYLEDEGKRIIQFFVMKPDKLREIELPEEVIYLGTQYDLAYFVSINKEKARYPKMIEIHIDRPLGVLQARLEVVRNQMAQFERDLKDFALYLKPLQDAFIEKLNEYHLNEAVSNVSFPLHESIFVVEGWVPKTRLKALQGLMKNMAVQAEEISIEKTDKIPTYMENKGAGALGEDLVHIYDIPDTKDKDPSTWVLIFFTIFFAMIVADGGYGILYLGLALFLRWKFPHVKGMLKRFFNLIFILACAVIIWGVATASFFGIEVGPNNSFRKASLIHFLAKKKAEYHMKKKDDVYEYWVKEYPAAAKATNGHDFFLATKTIKEGKTEYQALTEFYDNILMELSLLLGVIHLSLSFLRYIRRDWAGLGWVLFMVGGYLSFPSFLKATSMLNFLGIIDKSHAFFIGEYMLYGGMAFAVVAAIIENKLAGIHEIFNVIQVFADVLSYLRIYALALAGMITALTFNQIGLDLGLLYGGIFVIIAGHGVNILLGIMGGVIHGLRLNFLEWYHYCFVGGGTRFDPLRLLNRPSSK